MPMDVASKCGGEENIKHLVKIRFMSQFLNSFILNFHPLHEQKGSPALASYWLLLLLHFTLHQVQCIALYLAVKYVSLLLSLLFQMEYRFKRKRLRERIQFSR